MNNYNCLDLDKVKNEVAHYAIIDDSKNYILNEEVTFNPLVIKRKIIETNEFLLLLKDNFNISFDGIENVKDILNKASKEIVLIPIELLKILTFHNHCERIKKLFNRVDSSLNIRDYSDSLYINNNLAIQINKIIDNNGNIRDDASLKLKEINRNIQINEKALNDSAKNFILKHSDSLQEQTMYIRNNRVAFLVKNSYKNKYKGYSYGSSSSGLACYVEPEFIVNLNNIRISLQEEKESEIEKILRSLTYIVSENSENYINNFDILVNIDVIHAKALYGYNNFGIVGNIVEKNLYLQDICHPLISKDLVVSNTYSIDEKYKGIVISGTNTGGKTVSLKLIGLAVILTYLGIPLIATKADIPIYDNVYVDIDDNQSIFNSLSTFSAHISNINNILKNSTNKSLILIDELISGTDPKEAQAISLAILNKIEEIGSKFVVTTHYDDVKNYSYKNSDILLSSVGFNNDTLKPTYKYIENSVGSSNAMEVASKYFDDQSLIDKAKQFLKQSNTKENELLDKLAKEINDNIIKNNKINELINQNELLKNDLENKINNFENNKAKLKEEYINKFEEYFNELKENYIHKFENAKDINEVKKITNNNEKTYIKQTKQKFNISDNVKVGEGDRIGTIISINGKNVEVNINGIIVKTNINNLKLMPKQHEKKITVKHNEIKLFKREINLVGYHIDEALNELDVFLNNATSARIDTVKIIHGNGTGQLRKAIRDYLKKNNNVKEFSDGDFYDGGSAITMAKLK